MVGLVGGQPGQSAQQTRQQGNQSDADQGNTTARDKLFYPQIGVGKRLDGGRRRVKKYLWTAYDIIETKKIRLERMLWIILFYIVKGSCW